MTITEVEVILGGPGRDMSQGIRGWTHADGSFVLILFSDGSVTHKLFGPSSETYSDKLSRWLHLPK